LGYLGPVMLTILALLGILFISYWQTIEAYPKSGGAYTVSQANLGVNASLLAAAALMVDYVPQALRGWFLRCRLCMYIRCRFASAFLSSLRSLRDDDQLTPEQAAVRLGYDQAMGSSDR
jgi:hypothetical protein